MLDTPGTFAVAETQGFILVRAIAGEAEILTLAVAPPSRRQGLARRLVEQAVVQALALGAEAMFLEVADDNAPGTWILADRAGNKVCVVGWPDGSIPPEESVD